MFELVKACELAKGEKHIFLRFIYTHYTKWALKHAFFEKFDIYTMRVDRKLINEFFQLYDCVNSYAMLDQRQNTLYPYISTVFTDKKVINIQYYNFKIKISMSTLIDEFTVAVTDLGYQNSNLSFHVNEELINKSCMREIILMTIYNYCVAYIYGNKSSLYIDDRSFIKTIKDFYI